jgi:hypothetical protein
MHKYSTGTDGCRVLCHQFSTSSLLLLGKCISRCNTFLRKMNSFKEATLLFSNTDDQDQNTRTTVFALNAGPTVKQRVVEQKEPLRTVAVAYGVSHETIRRILIQVQKQRGQQ